MAVKVKICVKNLYQVKTPTIIKSKKWEKQLNSGVITKVDSYKI